MSAQRQRPGCATHLWIVIGVLGQMEDHSNTVSGRRGAKRVKGVTVMLMPWAIDEMKNVDLKDKRLNDRLTAVRAQLGGHPTASVPAACGGGMPR